MHDRKTYKVYEYNAGHESNFIGTVVARDRSEAVDKAHSQYGAPIEVRFSAKA